MTTPAALPTAEVVLVDPWLARIWLAGNTSNRRLRRLATEEYARDMAAGKWKLTGDAVKFAADGTLLDGQHRLHAIIEADVPVPMFVVRGIEKDAQAAMDIGRKRYAHDALRLRGQDTLAHEVSSITRSVLMYGGIDRPTVAEVVEFAEAHTARLMEAAQYGHKIKGAGLRGGSIWGAAHFILAGIDEVDAAAFAEAIASGVMLTDSDPVLHLRRRFLTGAPATHRDITSLRYNLSHVFRAWNKWRAGEGMALLRVNRGERVTPH